MRYAQWILIAAALPLGAGCGDNCSDSSMNCGDVIVPDVCGPYKDQACVAYALEDCNEGPNQIDQLEFIDDSPGTMHLVPNGDARSPASPAPTPYKLPVAVAIVASPWSGGNYSFRVTAYLGGAATGSGGQGTGYLNANQHTTITQCLCSLNGCNNGNGNNGGSCGALGQACCSGGGCNNQPNVVCDTTSNMCVSCGATGQACCSAGSDGLSGCGSGCCAMSGVSVCVAPGDACPNNDVCTSNGQCGKCGDAGQACCAGDTCMGGACCDSGSCVAPGGSCALSKGFCQSGQCQLCGEPGQACCPYNSCGAGGCCDGSNGCIGLSGPCLQAGGTCNNGGSCGGGSCGGNGQPCCGASNECTAPFSLCNGSTCASCGGPGQACCPGGICQVGSCNNGSC